MQLPFEILPHSLMRFTSIAMLFDEIDPVVIHLGSTIHTSPDMYHVRALQSDRLTSPDRNDSLSSGNDGGTVEFASECLLEDDRRWSQIYRELFLVENSFSVGKGLRGRRWDGHDDVG